MKKIVKYLLVILLLLVAAYSFVPWKDLVETRLKNQLSALGMEQLEFHIESVALNEITFKDIVFGEFKLPSLSVKYKPLELLFDKEKANFDIIEAKIFWNEGEITTSNISVPIFATTPIAFTLKVKQVSLNTLLAAATSNRATATGAVSGTLPIVINRDGTFILKKGSLKADKAGTLKLSPDVIPAEAEQVALLRDALQDFHYSVFSMAVESADSKQLAMLLSLEGNNPSVYNGRVIKLNVHLTGDVIDLIAQSMNLLK